MLRAGPHKLIYYPAGNRVQLFNLRDDPQECHDLAANQEHRRTLETLTAHMIECLTDDERAAWTDGNRLRGEPDEATRRDSRDLGSQRGFHY
mgnify:CR=1 FL=1